MFLQTNIRVFVFWICAGSLAHMRHSCSAYAPHVFRICGTRVPHMRPMRSAYAPHAFRICGGAVPHMRWRFFWEYFFGVNFEQAPMKLTQSNAYDRGKIASVPLDTYRSRNKNLIFSDPVLASFERVMLQNSTKIIEIFIKTMQTLNLIYPDANDL